MVTMQLDTSPESLDRLYTEERRKRRRICTYEMGREASAVTVFLFGLGVLVFVIGLCTPLYSVGHGFIGLVASCIPAFALRAYCGRWDYRDTVD